MNALGEALLRTVTALEVAALLLYALPYTTPGKAAAVSRLAATPTLEWVRQNAYGPIALSLLAMLRAETDAARSERIKSALLMLIFLRRSHDRIVGSDIGILVVADQTAEERAFLEFKPPSKRTIRWVTRTYRACFDPVFLGEENLPKPPRGKPVLFVANHSLLGFEYPLLLSYLWDKHDIFLRVLADHAHFSVPINAKFLRDTMGAVDGTRRNVDLLMARNEALFVYPGGARETLKKTTDEKYALAWEGRTGFAAMAIRWGATIIPISNFGTEDMVDIVADLPLGYIPIPYLWGSDRSLPLVVPKRLERIYFCVGEPIPTAHLDGNYENEANVLAVKHAAQDAIERGMQLLRARRAIDFPDDTDAAIRERTRSTAQTLARYIRSLVGGRL